MTVGDVYARIDAFAPFDTQADFDHSGLQAGDMSAPVSGVLVAVDLTLSVIEEAVAMGYNTIVVHHPPIWSALPAVTEGEYTQRLARRLVQRDLNCIAAHTNVDKCAGGNSERLIEALGGKVTGRLDCDEYAVTFEIAPIRMKELQDEVRRVLDDPYAYGVGADNIVCGGALCTGAGFDVDAWRECHRKGLVYMTGEVKHHALREVEDEGGNMIVFGHFASEKIFVDIITSILDEAHIECAASKQDNPAGIK